MHTPDDVRRYFADVVTRVGSQLNPAHLYLASLIADSPRMFGTVFTTNFDPLLQRSLQLVSVPYFVSDRPDTMEHADDDDIVEALHVVHAHGSIYRYLLLNTPEQIEDYATRNQSLLQDYFRKHTVLIVGYSGWDDAITRALGNVSQFDHNLYWCDRGQHPDVSGLSIDARKLLQKHSNSFYVPIDDAGKLMVQLHRRRVGHALPRVFREPISVMRTQLQRCDLDNVFVARTDYDRKGVTDRKHSDLTVESLPGTGTNDELNLGHEVNVIKTRLIEAERRFKGDVDIGAANNDTALVAARVRERMTSAIDQYFSGRYADAIPHLDFVLQHGDMISTAELALVRYRRGYAYAERGEADDINRGIADYTAVIEMPDVSPDLRARTYVSRGICYGRRGQPGDIERSLADLTSVVDMPDVSVDQRARARVNRGVSYGARGLPGDTEREIADYDAVIATPDAPTEDCAEALLNRGTTYGQRSAGDDVGRAIEDFTTIINMIGASTEQLAKARVNRGATYAERDHDGDVALAIADATAVIAMSDAPVQQRAQAYYNRGVTYRMRGHEGDLTLSIADFGAILEMAGVPVEQLARARVNRGTVFADRGHEGDVNRAIADNTAVIDMPDAPVDQYAKARFNRGISYGRRGGEGDVDREIADYTAVIDTPSVAVETLAGAYLNRGVACGVRGNDGDAEREITDYTAIIGIRGAPATDRATARLNRGIAYLQRGHADDAERAATDFVGVSTMEGASPEQQERAKMLRATLMKADTDKKDRSKAVPSARRRANKASKDS